MRESSGCKKELIQKVTAFWAGKVQGPGQAPVLRQAGPRTRGVLYCAEEEGGYRQAPTNDNKSWLELSEELLELSASEPSELEPSELEPSESELSELGFFLLSSVYG